MTAMIHHNVVSLINARRARITPANDIADPAVQRRELAEAELEAPMIVDALPEDFGAVEADDDHGLPGTAALVAISVGVVLGVAAAALIIIAFEWLLGVV